MNIVQKRALSDITQKVKDAMAAACNDMLRFSDEPAREINAEYLLTVNVAKAIDELNMQPADPYKIYIEKHTRDFARDCLHPILFGKPLVRNSSVFRKGRPSIKRNGRIDVVVYYNDPLTTYFGTQPLCAIELKGFNPSRTLVVADLQRNLEFHKVVGDTGESVLPFSLFSALHSFNSTYDEAGLRANLTKVHSFYKSLFPQVGDLSGHELTIRTFTVSHDLIGRVLDEGEEHEALDTDARHHFVGAIVLCLKAHA
nr:hypothetical protein [uncultured Pseudomonas sp.]